MFVPDLLMDRLIMSKIILKRLLNCMKGINVKQRQMIMIKRKV